MFWVSLLCVFVLGFCCVACFYFHFYYLFLPGGGGWGYKVLGFKGLFERTQEAKIGFGLWGVSLRRTLGAWLAGVTPTTKFGFGVQV